MRFLHHLVLVLTTAFLISGCGEAKPAKELQPASTASGFRETATYDMAAPSSVPETAARGPMSRTSFAEGADADLASVPLRDVAKAEPPRSPKPAEMPIPADEPLTEPKRERNRQQIQAGTLTAGSLNDHANLQDYRDYLSQAQQSSAGRNLPAFTLGERVMIEVQDEQGNGVSDVHVTVAEIGQAQGDNEGVLLDTFTRADGRAFFSSGLDARAVAEGKAFELTVRPPQGQPIIKQVSLSQSPWVVQLDNVASQLPRQLDLALVVDTTSSMGDELNYLKVELDNIVSTIHRMYPHVEQRYSLIVYRDEGDEYVVRNVTDFIGSLPEFRAKLAAQSAKGGGDIPEAMHLALENANKLSWRRDNTARVMFLVADAPPHRQHYQRTLDAVSGLRQKGVAIYPLAGSGPMQECEFIMRAAAFLTRGQYLFLTDHSGVGNPHAKPHAPKYEVEPLNQLMIRMIASELSGKPVLAQEILATEESDGSEPDPIPQEQNQSATDPPDHDFQSAHLAQEPIHEFGICGTVPNALPFWETTAFRIVAAFVLIGGILLMDNRLRS